MEASCGLTFTLQIGFHHDSAQKNDISIQKIIAEITKFHFDKQRIELHLGEWAGGFGYGGVKYIV
jgi:hypothetical protein